MIKQFSKKHISTDTGDIYYFFHKGTSKKTIVFLHGLSSNHTTWLDTARQLSEADFTVLLVDLRGHGYSDKTRRRSLYFLQNMSTDLKKIFEAERIENALFVGYSFGGMVALDFAIRFVDSVCGLVLVSTNGVSPFVYRRLSFLNQLLIGMGNMLGYLLVWQSRKKYDYYIHNSTTSYWKSVIDGLKTMPLSVNLWLLTETLKIDLLKKVSFIRSPILIVRGVNDPFLTHAEAVDMKNSAQHAEIVELSANGHFLATESSVDLLKIIFKFLQHENCNI